VYDAIVYFVVFDWMRRWVPKNQHVFFLVLTLLLGSSIMFVPLLQIFVDGEILSLGQYAIVSFMSYLFVTWTFIEVLHIQVLLLWGSMLLITVVAVVSAMAWLMVDYVIGYSFSKAFITRFFSEKKIDSYSRKIEKYGHTAIFVFNALPLAAPMLLLVAGLLRLNAKKAFLFAFLWLVLKYMTLAVVIRYFL